MTTATAGTREQLLQGIPARERRLELAGISTPVLDGGNPPPERFLASSFECQGASPLSWPGGVLPHPVMSRM